MSKGRVTNRLGTQLALAAICSALAAFLLFVSLEWGLYRILDRYMLDTEAVIRKEKAYVASLQNYITENGLSVSQTKQIDVWMEKERYLILTIYSGNQMVYSSDRSVASEVYIDDGTVFYDIPWAYQISFADSDAFAVVTYLAETACYTVADWICSVAAVLCFVVLLLCFIRKKMKYIELLEKELKILKGGDLDYEVTVRGSDELASLAAELDRMRLAIRQRMEREEEARQANRELVTAMSHDLRTPLTALLGYVDILVMGKSRDEEQRERCLGAVRQKAYQIKELSDKLFEYFIVYGKEADKLEMEEVNGAEFIGQIVEESLFDLESEGFEIKRTSDEINCHLTVDIGLTRRVFGNVFSNLLKYADKTSPIYVVYEQEAKELVIRFSNRADRKQTSGESSGIGLKTCGKIMEDHCGTFFSRLEGGMYITEIRFPIKFSAVDAENVENDLLF